MDFEERVRKAINQIARRRSNVTLEEIEWVVEKLAQQHTTRTRKARHGVLFGVDNQRFMVNCHNPGSKQVKKYSVDAFIDAMTELGWYDEDEIEGTSEKK
jgi:hypothetical protein